MIVAVGCSKQNVAHEEFFIFANYENMNNELIQSLCDCLENQGIEYIIDNENNVLIKRKDSGLAVTECS